MPKITNPTNYKCFLCGSQAYFISFNAGNPRCVEKVTQCPGFVKKAEDARQQNISEEDRRKHMKIMSDKGNKKLKTLHEDISWRKTKGDNISKNKAINGSAIDPSLKSEWRKYEDSVDRLTRDSWVYYQDKINPTKLIRGKEFELDHKYSKKDGFVNKVPPEIIGHYSNLALIEKSVNRRKYSKSSITLEELYAGFHSTIPSDSPSSETTTS